MNIFRRGSVFAGLVAGSLLATAVATTIGGPGDVPRSGAALYDYVAAAAAQGDERAQEQLSAIRAFMELRGLTRDDLSLPSDERTERRWSNGLVKLGVDDHGPWRLDIHNDTMFEAAADVAAYRAARHAALDVLARTDGQRIIEVAVSPRGELSVQEFARAMPDSSRGVRMVVDIFSEAGWLMASGYDISGRDFVADADSIASGLLDQAAQSLDQFEGVDRGDLRAVVRVAHLRLPASVATDVSRSAKVLAVDPLTDIADAFAGQAAIIEVVNSPELRAIDARLRGVAIDRNPVSPVGR